MAVPFGVLKWLTPHRAGRPHIRYMKPARYFTCAAWSQEIGDRPKRRARFALWFVDWLASRGRTVRKIFREAFLAPISGAGHDSWPTPRTPNAYFDVPLSSSSISGATVATWNASFSFLPLIKNVGVPSTPATSPC